MATAYITPPAASPVPSGYMPVKAIARLLAETGHPAGVTTIRQWRARYRIDSVRCGRTDYYDFSGVLEAHRQELENRSDEPGSGAVE